MDIFILNFLTDFDFVIKIFFVLTVIAFVRQKITHNTLSLLFISIAIIGMVFLWWPFFRATYLVYVILTIGITSVLVDMFFVTMGHGSGEEAMQMKDEMHASEHVEHQQHLAHKSHGGHRPRMPFMPGH
jgi:hypothetical protein